MSVIGITLTMVVTSIATLFVLGEVTRIELYPVMSIVRYVNLANFVEHVEAIVMAIWISGIFVKFSLYYYTLVLGTAQWLGLSEYRALVLPIGFLQVVGSIWVAQSVQQMGHFFATTGAFFTPLIEIMNPLFLLIVALLQKKFKNKNPKPRSVG
nr:GerAB/ArcD/ProY family transporter [Bacillus sp. MUM 116]